MTLDKQNSAYKRRIKLLIVGIKLKFTNFTINFTININFAKKMLTCSVLQASRMWQICTKFSNSHKFDDFHECYEFWIFVEFSL